MSTTELRLKTDLEGRVLRTLQTFFRRANVVLIRESLVANGLTAEQADFTVGLIEEKYTVSEIMETLSQKGFLKK